MTTTRFLDIETEPEAFIASVVAQLEADRGVRRSVPGGWLRLDRPLPFLCIYRQPMAGGVAGAERLVVTQAAHLTVSDDAKLAGAVHRLVATVAETMADRFGAYLVVDVWADGDGSAFRVLAPPTEPATTVTVLAEALAQIDVAGAQPAVEIVDHPAPSPPGAPALLSAEDQRRVGALLIGLQVPRFFVDESGQTFPLVFRRLQRDLAGALQRAVFEFTNIQTSFTLEDFRALGPRRLSKPAQRVDRELADVAGSVDYLLAVTPINAEAAWAAFRDDGFRSCPTFHYRPLKVDPDLLKRTLYEIPVDRVDDPTLAALFREKRHELDRRITLLEDRGAPAFVHTSLQLFGGVESDLLTLAEAVLARVSTRTAEPTACIDAAQFAAQARAELARYRSVDPGLATTVAIRDDVPGVVVANGQLLVGSHVSIPAARAEALVQHEIGTHVVTEANGRAQPLHLLRVGLPGHDETQEALAALAEFVAGGLTGRRLVTLGARVVAVHCLVEGATFVETFRVLHERHRLTPRAAFQVTMRVFRSGGLTKDAIYLRGLDRLLHYLAAGNALEPLLIGKLAIEHVPIVEELRWREVLQPARLRPRWLDLPGAQRRLDTVRSGITILDLAEAAAP